MRQISCFSSNLRPLASVRVVPVWSACLPAVFGFLTRSTLITWSPWARRRPLPRFLTDFSRWLLEPVRVTDACLVLRFQTSLSVLVPGPGRPSVAVAAVLPAGPPCLSTS